MKLSSPLEKAYSHCEQMAKSHYENFPVGSLLIPKDKRPHVWSIYAFARSADDFADENYPLRSDFPNEDAWRACLLEQESERLAKLNEWQQWLLDCAEGKATHPIFIALGHTIRELNIPLPLLVDLLTAFKMDVTKRRHENWEEVLYYCRHSANPVGRLVLRVFGYSDSKLDEMSDGICTGLQLANFWQDIAVDREKDRIYIPQDLFKKYQLSLEDFFSPQGHFEWKSLFEELGRFTLPLFLKGKELPLQVKGRLAWELKCTWLGGMNILQRACFNPLRNGLERPQIQKKDKLKILWQSLRFQHWNKAPSLSLG